MHVEPPDVVQRSRLRGRAVRTSGNLLILIGTVLLGSSLVAATPASDTWTGEAPASTVHATAMSLDRSTADRSIATRVPSETTLSRVRAATPTATQGRIEPSQSTWKPEPGLQSPKPLQFGEGLVEPVGTVQQSSSPYVQNMSATRAIRISAPAVGIDAEIKEVSPVAVQVDQQTVFEWPVADWAAGHHSTSANPGDGGNIVIAGHSDVRGEVFRGLHNVKIGDQVIVSTDSASHTYVVQEIHMRLYNTAPLEEQLSVGAFIGPMPEERLTLVTCWPYQVDTHRMIVVAKPL